MRSDPVHATTLQPNLSAYGTPQRSPYQTTWEKYCTAAVLILVVGVTLATGGLSPRC